MLRFKVIILLFFLSLNYVYAYNIVFISDAEISKSDNKLIGVYDLYKAQKANKLSYFTLNNYKSNLILINKADFIFLSLSSRDEKFKFNNDFVTFLNKYLTSGGKLVLLGTGLFVLDELNLEKRSAEKRNFTTSEQTYIGIQSLPEHLLFQNIPPGVYFDVFNREYELIGYFDDFIPLGKVVGVELNNTKAYLSSKLAIEYSKGKGRVLAIGILPNLKNELINEDLSKFFLNIPSYLNSTNSREETFWNYEKKGIYPFLSTYNSKKLDSAVFWTLRTKLPSAKSYFPTSKSWVLSGDGLLCLGKDSGGIDYLYSRKFCALENYQAGIIFQDVDTITYLSELKPEIIYFPQCFVRIYKIGRIFLREIITLDAEQSIALVHYEYSGAQPIKIVCRFRTSFTQLMPYDNYQYSNLFYSYDKVLNSFIIKDGFEKNVVLITSNKEFSKQTIGRYSDFKKYYSIYEGVKTSEFVVSGFMEFDLSPKDALDIYILSSSNGIDNAFSILEKSTNCEQIFNRTTDFYEQNLDLSFQFKSSQLDLDDAFLWSKINLLKFNKNQIYIYKNNILSDIWSSIAYANIGDFKSSKDKIVKLLSYQKSNGLIPKDVLNYGNSDVLDYTTTSLLLVAISRYFKASADYSFVMENWSKIAMIINGLKKALKEKIDEEYSFLYSTALEEVAYVCDKLVKYEYLPEYLERDIVKDKEKNRVMNIADAHNLFLKMYFNAIDEGTIDTVLFKFRQCENFTKKGIIQKEAFKESKNSDKINLYYTGLNSIAEFSNLYSFFGYEKLASILRNFDLFSYKSFSIKEDIDYPEEFISSIFINVLIEGLLGVEFSSIDKTIKISPHILPFLDSIKIDNIYIGAHRINFSFGKSKDTIIFNFIKKTKEELNVEFYPIFPVGTEIYIASKEKIEGNINSDLNPVSTILQLTCPLKEDKKFTFEQINGISVIPTTVGKVDNYNYFQITNTKMKNNQFIVELEGSSGNTFSFNVSCPTNLIKSVINGKVINSTERTATIEFTIPRASTKFNKHIVIINM